jgi:hypothetical protein
MTITVPLNPLEEARLLAAARERGVSTDALVREALDMILTRASEQAAPRPESRSIRDLIQDNMKDVPSEEFAKLPIDGASEHDHYLYGHAKRGQ